MEALALYALLTGALFYLGIRARITAPLWSLYTRRLARFMDCAACIGFWYGAGAALVLRLDFLGLDGEGHLTPLAVGLCAVAWTPVVAALQHRALEALGTVVSEEDVGGQA
jgi:hypothetical protein